MTKLLRHLRQRTLFLFLLLGLCMLRPAAADDTDLFQQSGGNSSAPNVLFVLGNTANWATASQAWGTYPTAGQAELAAIKNFVAGLTKPVNVGIMMFTDKPAVGGYVRFGIRSMSDTNSNQALQNITQSIYTSLNAGNSGGENVAQSKGGIADTFYEAWLYLTGATSSAAADSRADYSGNTAANTTSTSTPHLTSGFAYQSSPPSKYLPPSGGNCGNTYIIFIGNNTKAASPAAPGSASNAVLSQYGYTNASDPQSAWARFLRLRPDLGAGTTAANNGAVYTYTIDAYKNNQSTSYTTVLQNMAASANGGGKYYQAGTYDDLMLAFNDIFGKILAVNSVFASASLPVSVSVRGTYLNQVYLGVFRPDANSLPNWAGNLKQYKLGVNNSTTPPSLFLTDSLGAAAENPVTGFVNPAAVSFWTQTSTFWTSAYYPNSQGAGGSSDSPDGDLVEKGGAAQYIRTTFATSQAGRNVYTCVGTTCTGGALLSSMPFTATNTAVTGSVSADVVNWVRGGNVNLDDPANASSPATNIRGFVHGDVLHSRPAVVNYNRTSDDIVVYYGANDGMLHAVKGGQNTANNDGNELWAFIAPEHFPQLTRLKSHTPTISSLSPKPYFVDGSPTVYTYSSANDGKIDYTRGDKAYLFLTMRRGGSFIYALDVSNPSAPKLLWKKQGGSSPDTGFGEMAQTWSDLRVAKLRGQTNPMLIFGLGYDATANDPIVQLVATKGRGVMVLDATTGSPIWQAGPAPAGAQVNKTVAGMAYAIPATVALYDSNSDGYIDRIYAADTGANLWRINVNDTDPNNWTVSQLASLGGTGANARKFMFPPDIVPADTSNTFDSLLIGSGDREHPFDTTIQNRYYMIKDDHGLLTTRASPITEGTASATTGVAGQLYDATANLVQVGTAAQQAAAKTALQNASGWYVTLGSGEKVVSGSTTLAGTVFFGTNAPTPPSSNTCGSLGVARLYGMSYLDGSATIDHNLSGLTTADRSSIRAGGGYPPTPVPISVVIGTGTYQGAISGTQVLSAPGPALGRRYRTFWQRLIDAN